MDMTEIIDLYCKAWSASDAEERVQLLTAVWAADASYVDPSVSLKGVGELLAHIAQVQAQFPGLKIVRRSKVDCHHNVARFAWQAIKADGQPLPEGLDLAFITDDGLQLAGIIGFFGPLKPLVND